MKEVRLKRHPFSIEAVPFWKGEMAQALWCSSLLLPGSFLDRLQQESREA